MYLYTNVNRLFQSIFYTDSYLSHDALVVHVETQLPQAIPTERHLGCLAALSQELFREARSTEMNYQGSDYKKEPQKSSVEKRRRDTGKEDIGLSHSTNSNLGWRTWRT